ncbi:MAG: thioredoxin domain-containing protein [Candidatus Colwellbacteria bacterium]|nr:thioredoxin domain-containing protein [Candidatus Colwellbacteria bacterium]
MAHARRPMRSLLTPLVVILFAAGVVGGLVRISAPASSPDRGGETLPVLAVGAADRQKGPFEAPITIIEYSDFQCPACAYYEPLRVRLAEEFSSEVRIVYRHFPLSEFHMNALPAAYAAEAAGEQGAFWEMHDVLFYKQAEWVPLVNSREAFARYAAEIGIDVERFKRSMSDAVLRGKVRADYEGGVELRIAGTPTFFVNGERIEPNPRTYDEFKGLILSALSEAR